MNDIPDSVPRAYQNEIFQHAIRKNVIAVMGTGTGKTLIACMLIKYMHSIPLRKGMQKKVSVFVVPTVPLVYQQADTIEKFTGLEVKSFCGEMGVDFWDRNKWIEELDLENTDVIVLTPQILLNTLSHAYLDISVFDLLVIDECHHARKGNPIAVALRTFYHSIANGKARPKVLGLTASPIWTPDNPEQSLHELQMTLASTIVAVKANIFELEMHAPRPKEHIVFYKPDIIAQNTELYGELELYDELTGLPRDWTLGKLAWPKIKLRARVALEGLGPLGMDLYLVKQLQEPVREVVREKKLGLTLPNDVDWQLAKKLFRILDPLDVDIGSSVPLDALSPKFRQLVATLTKHHRAGIAEEEEDSQFQAIIFVTQRHIAFGLADLLEKLDELSGWIEVKTLVGHGSNDYVAGGQAFTEQKRLVRDFRDGKFNVLISTSVGEEGLDFPACALVIRYDVNTTMIGYLQSRGRARQKTSEYVVLIDEYDPKQLDDYKKYVAYEDLMAEDYRMSAHKAPAYREQEIGIHPDDQALRQTYRIKTTGALLTFERAISLINETCSLLPATDGIPPPRPTFEVEEISQAIYRCRVILPAATALPVDRLIVTARPRRTKMEAKRAVAFEACKILHRFNLLNDYLIPHREPEGEEAVDIDGRLVGTDLAVEFDVTMDPVWGNMWKSPDRVYLTPIFIDGKECLGLISGKPLAKDIEFPMWSGKATAEKKRHAKCATSKPLDFTAEQAHDLFFPYTERAFKEVIAHGRVLAQQLALLLVPLKNGSVDHAMLEKAFNPVPDERGRIGIVANGPYGRPVGIDRFRPDISLETPAKDVLVEQADIDTSTMKDSTTYRDYLAERYGRRMPLLMESLDDGSPLVEVLHLSKRRNNLISAKDAIKTTNVFGRTKGPITEIFPESWLVPSFFDADVFDQLQMIPSIIRYVTDVERIRPHAERLGLGSVDLGIIREAVTPPQASAGIDYQRLETLGDRVLQLCTTVHVYHKYPFKNEGKLHVLRRNSVCNRYLRRRAEEAGLHTMICPELLTIAKWDWPDAKTEETLTINRKWLQDGTEALLGAAYAAGGWPLSLKAGDALGLPFGGTVAWTERYLSITPMDLHETSDVLEKLQRKLKYRFKNPLLLLEAITHPSLTTVAVPSYNRLEFLGDAVLDMIVVERMYNKYPKADPGELTRRKMAIVSNATLGWISVVDLELAVHIQHSSVAIPRLILEAMEIFRKVDVDTLLNEHWEYHPAKLLADVVESIIGAMFVDVQHDYEEVKKLVLPMIEKVLQASDTCRINCPIMELMAWAGSQYKCQKIRFEQNQEEPRKSKRHSYQITIHGMPLASKEGDYGYAVKCALSVEAMQILRDEEGMSRYCNCDKANLTVKENKSTKRKCEQAQLDDSPATKMRHQDDEDVAMFDYSVFYCQEADTGDACQEEQFDLDDDEEVEELLPGMNAPGYTSALPDCIPDSLSIEEGPAQFERQVIKRQSFYVEATHGEVFMEVSDDEEVVSTASTGGRSRPNTAVPRGFTQGEVIVIDDD